MEKFKKVLHKCFLYDIIILWLKFWFKNVYYKRVLIKGLRNVLDSPVIFAPNHPNSFVDDVAILSTNKRKTVIVGHASLFKNRLITKILIFFRLIPAFRKEDGKENLHKNALIFNLAVNILQHSFALLIFPEARHTGKNHLFPIRKGAVRIAFHYLENNNFSGNIYLVPVGLYYRDFSKYRSEILINYGRPINLLDYKDLYLCNPSKAISVVRFQLENAIKSLILHIPTEDYNFYDAFRKVAGRWVADIRGQKIVDVEEELLIHKEVIIFMEDLSKKENLKFESLRKGFCKYTKLLSKKNITDENISEILTLRQLLFRSLIAVIYLPIYLVLLLNFSFPILLTEFIASLFPDKSDKASVRFVAPMVFVSIWAMIEIFWLWQKFNFVWIKVVYAFLHPFLFVVLVELNIWMKDFISQWKLRIYAEYRNEILRVKRDLFEQFELVWKRKQMKKICRV